MIGELVSEYGYASTGESISISDANEVWLLEIIGKGEKQKGGVWVAVRIPDGKLLWKEPVNDPESSPAIDASGIITWTPSQNQSPSTNTITTVVTNSNPYDLVNPLLTATSSFTAPPSHSTTDSSVTGPCLTDISTDRPRPTLP